MHKSVNAIILTAIQSRKSAFMFSFSYNYTMIVGSSDILFPFACMVGCWDYRDIAQPTAIEPDHIIIWQKMQ